MKLFSHAALFILLLACQAHAMQARVDRVIDGDTIKVSTVDGPLTIRLYGVDSPERKQAFGQAAQNFTETLVAGKSVNVEPIDIDRYGRTVAIVMLGTQNLQEQLLLSGYAWVYPQYCKKAFCQPWTVLQGISAGNRVGLWAGPAPVRPWEWRKQNR